MKKNRKKIITYLLIIMFFIIGVCSYNIVNKIGSNNKNKLKASRNEINYNLKTNKQKDKLNSESFVNKYFGEWKITKVLGFERYAKLDITTANKQIGTRITFNSHEFKSTDDSEVCKNPYYYINKMKNFDFEEGYMVDSDKLGLNNDTVISIQVRANKSEVSVCSYYGTFCIKDENTIIFINDAFYEAKRVK